MLKPFYIFSRYVEVSAKTGDGISDMFQSLTKSMMSTWENWHSSDLHLRSKRSSAMMMTPMKSQSTPSSSRPKNSTSTTSSSRTTTRSSLMFLQTRSETLRASFRWRKNKKMMKKGTKKEDINQEIEGEGGDEEMVEVIVVPAAAAEMLPASTKNDAAASPEIVTKKPHTKIFCCMS